MANTPTVQSPVAQVLIEAIPARRPVAGATPVAQCAYEATSTLAVIWVGRTRTTISGGTALRRP